MPRQRMGICTNVNNNCSLADKKQKIPFTSQGMLCPECELDSMIEIPASNYLLKIGGLASILVFIGGIGWFWLPNGQLPPPLCGPTEIETPNGCIPEPPPSCGPNEIETPSGCIPKPPPSFGPNEIETPSGGIPEPPPSCGPNEIETPNGCVPEPPPVSELQKKLGEIQTQIEQIQAKMGNSSIDSMTTQLDNIQRQIENIQTHLRNSPENNEVRTLQETIKTQQTQIEQLTNRILADKKVPNCLSSAQPEIRNKLPVFFVPAVQNRTIPHELQDWMKGVAHATINESAFFIMRREVMVGEFQSYVNTLEEQQKTQLEEVLKQQENNNPVASVPWWAANGYANWLSKQTGCRLTLPTYNQWVAASIRYAKPKQAIIRDQQFRLEPREVEPSEVLDLLGNLREWSIDNQGQEPCSTGSHYLLGEDYKTWRENLIGEPICESSPLDTVGFRLVLQE